MRFLILTLVLLGCSAVPSPEPEVIAGILGARQPVSPKATLHCDVDFATMERLEISAAAELWRMQTDGVADLKLVWDVDFTSTLNIVQHSEAKHHMLLRLESWMDLVTEEDTATGSLLGITSPAGGLHGPWHKPVTVGLVVDRVGDAYKPGAANLTQIALHEFGHMVGVPHQGQVGAIMYQSAIKHRAVCLKKADLSAFCAVNECGKTYPCE